MQNIIGAKKERISRESLAREHLREIASAASGFTTLKPSLDAELTEYGRILDTMNEELKRAMHSTNLQVVGHTPVRKICVTEMKDGPVLSTDVFSTYNNGAPFGEKRFAIVDTTRQTWEYAKEEE